MKCFANETACINRVLICHVCIYLKLSIEQNNTKARYTVVKSLLYSFFFFFFFFVNVRVNVPVRYSWPRKSYSAQIFQSPEQMLGEIKHLMYFKVAVGCSTSYRMC